MASLIHSAEVSAESKIRNAERNINEIKRRANLPAGVTVHTVKQPGKDVTGQIRTNTVKLQTPPELLNLTDDEKKAYDAQHRAGVNTAGVKALAPTTGKGKGKPPKDTSFFGKIEHGASVALKDIKNAPKKLIEYGEDNVASVIKHGAKDIDKLSENKAVQQAAAKVKSGASSLESSIAETEKDLLAPVAVVGGEVTAVTVAIAAVVLFLAFKVL